MPPSSPRVISEDGHIDTTGAIAGVYQEDEHMRLKCEVVGGESSWYLVTNHTNGGIITYLDTLTMFSMITLSRSTLAHRDVVDRRSDGGRYLLLGVGRYSHQQAHRHQGHQVNGLNSGIIPRQTDVYDSASL